MVKRITDEMWSGNKERCFVNRCDNDADFYIKPINCLEANGVINVIRVALGLVKLKPVCAEHDGYILWSRRVYSLYKKVICERGL